MIEKNTKVITDNWNKLEENRIAILPMLLLFQSCLGSMATCYILGLSDELVDIPLATVAITTIGANSIAIAQAHMKAIIYSSIISVICSVIFGTFALLSV